MKKDKVIRFRCSPAEHDEIKLLAENRELKVSAHCRACALEHQLASHDIGEVYRSETFLNVLQELGDSIRNPNLQTGDPRVLELLCRLRQIVLEVG
jgi:hypothetical protein